MAQRWYLLNAANSASNLPTSEQGAGTADVTWTNANSNKQLSGTATSTQSTVTGTGNSNAQRKHFCQRWVSGPLAAGTYGSGTWTIGIAAGTANVSQPFNGAQINIYFWRPSTQAKVGSSVYDTSGGTTRGGTAPSSSGENTTYYTVTGSNVTIQDGDVLCIEIWDTWTGTTTTSRTLTLYFGGTTEPTTDNVSASNCRSFVNAPAAIPEWTGGTLGVTLAAFTVAGTGDVEARGSLASTLASATVAGTGTTAEPTDVPSVNSLNGQHFDYGTTVHVTGTAPGMAARTGTLAATLVAFTLAGVGNAAVSGSLSSTLDSATLEGSADNLAEGTLGSTLDSFTVSGTGTVATPASVGSLASTLASFTLAATGTAQSYTDAPSINSINGQHFDYGTTVHVTGTTGLASSGSLAVTLASATVSGSGVVAVVGSSAVTLADTTVSGSGIVTNQGVFGSLSTTLAGITVGGTGEIQQQTQAPIVNSLNGQHFDYGVTVHVTGSTGTTGALSATLSSITVGGTGKVASHGVLASTLANFTVAGTGKIATHATLASTLANTTVSGTGIVSGSAHYGTLASTLAGISLVGAGTVPVTFAFTSPADYSHQNYPIPVSGTATPYSTVHLHNDLGFDLISPVQANNLGEWSSTIYGSGVATGTLIQTLASLTLVATGQGIEPVTGSLAVTLASSTLSATGKCEVKGSLSRTLTSSTLSASGHGPLSGITGVLSKTLANLTLLGQGYGPQNVEKRGGIGLNMGSLVYWGATGTVADHLKSGVLQNTIGNVDSNGWPTIANFTAMVATDSGYLGGRWVCYFDGTATVGALTVHGPNGNGPDGLPLGPNTRYVEWDQGSGSGGVSLNFTNANRNDGTGPGLTNIRIMRPAGEDNFTAAHTRAQTAANAALALVTDYGIVCFRFMNFIGVNWSNIRVWGGRPWQPNHAYQVGDIITTCAGADASDDCGMAYSCTVAGTSNANMNGQPTDLADESDGTLQWHFLGFGRPLPTWSGFHRSMTGGQPLEDFAYEGIGGCYEDAIKICNEAGADCYMCVPHKVDDDFIQKFALLFKWGSDGALPYTGPYGSGGSNPQPQTGPLYPGLAPGRRLYVEFSNEIWNFNMGDWIETNIPLDGVLDFDGDTQMKRYRHAARQMAKYSLALRAAFGDADMMTRIRPVIMTHATWAERGATSLKWTHEYLGDGDGLDHSASRVAHGFPSAPTPITDLLFGFGGAPYAQGSGSTVTDVLNSMRTTQAGGSYDLRGWIEEVQRIAAIYGLEALTYEGGPQRIGDPAQPLFTNAQMTARPTTPNMTDLIIANHQEFQKYGGWLGIYFEWCSAIDNNAPPSGLDWTWAHEDVGLSRLGNVWQSSPKLIAAHDIGFDLECQAIVLNDSTGLSYANSAPGTCTGSRYGFKWDGYSWSDDNHGTPTITRSDVWRNNVGYIWLASSQASFTIKCNATGGGQVSCFVDGVKLGSTQTASGDLTFGYVTWEAGLHGVIFVVSSGSATINNHAAEAWVLPAITSARFSPRAGQAAAMTGGLIRGSNVGPTSGFVTLGTISSQPAENPAYTTLNFSNSTAYRWLIYQAPSGSYGQIAELEFYAGAARVNGPGFGYDGSRSGNPWPNALDGDTATFFDGPQANGMYVGIDAAADHLTDIASFNPPPDSYATAQQVYLSCATSGATIRYTTDGSDPSGGTVYTGTPINVDVTMTIRVETTATGHYPNQTQGTYSIGGDMAQSSLHIGNSLTDMLEGNLQQLAASGGITLDYWRYTVPGAGTYVYDNYPTGGFGGIENIHTEVNSAPYDHLSMQPASNMPCIPTGHDGESDAGNRSDGVNIDEVWNDAVGPNANVQIWIYSTWPSPTVYSTCMTGSWDRDPAIWDPTPPATDWESGVNWMTEFNEAVQAYLVAQHPTRPAPYIVPCGSVFIAIKNAVEAGQIPGIATNGFWDWVYVAGFTDDDHLTAAGKYIVACTFYACMFQVSPVGLGYSWSGLTAGQAAAVQQIARDVVSGYAYSGYYR